MNSKLLEEAIIDAEALKEAALKNAEQAVLEKYAPEVRQAIDSLLEQEDPMMDPAMGEQAPEEDMDIPLKATEGEDLCPCPDEDEVITLSIGDLEKAISDIARANKVPQEEEAPMDMEPDMGMGEELPAPEETAPEGEEEAPEEEEALMEDLDISEDLIKSILSEMEDEDVEVDVDVEVEVANEEEPEEEKEEESEEESEEEKEMMQENKSLSAQNSKLLVEHKKSKKENVLLTEQISKLLEKHAEVLEENKKFKQTLSTISQRLDETNLMNAKLLYKNQALGSDSLNERQKNKIVEAVSKAGSVDEAKMIYETLCNAVGSFENKGPQSLSEAVEQRSSFIAKPRQQQNTSESNPLFNKWQKIAGIKK